MEIGERRTDSQTVFGLLEILKLGFSVEFSVEKPPSTPMGTDQKYIKVHVHTEDSSVHGQFYVPLSFIADMKVPDQYMGFYLRSIADTIVKKMAQIYGMPE